MDASSRPFSSCSRLALGPGVHENGGGVAYWLMRSTSTVLRSKSSKKGRAARPS